MARQLFLLVFISAGSVLSQSGYSVLDSYYGDFTQSNGYRGSLSNRIAYPGLCMDTVRRAGGGYHDSRLDRVYCWDEWDAGKDRFGAWIGDVSIVTLDAAGSRADEKWDQVRNGYQGSGALWFIPANHCSLQGISLFCTGDRVRDRTNREFWDTVEQHLYKLTDQTATDVSCVASSLFKASASNRIRISLANRWNREKETKSEAEYYNDSMHYYDRNSTGSLHRLALSADYITRRRTIVGAGVARETWDMVARYDNGSYYGVSHTGEGSCFISASREQLFRYKRHSAHILFKAYSDFSFPFTSTGPVGLSEVITSSHLDNRSVTITISAPALVEVNLFSWPAAVFARTDPEIVFVDRKEATGKVRSLSHRMHSMSLGLKATIGERLEFALVPSTYSSIFITALDIRYSIQGH